MSSSDLWHNKKEREHIESCADLFAIIKCAEKLERAYVRDAVSADEYEPACKKLIGQFRTLWGSMKDSGVQDVPHFMRMYNLECPMALTRLVSSGLPATIEHGGQSKGSDTSSAVVVAECVQFFITAMDGLKLNFVAVDQMYPYLSDLLQSLQKLPSLSPDHQGKVKIRAWVSRLNGMAAHETLNEEEARQLLFDLESAYTQFMTDIKH